MSKEFWLGQLLNRYMVGNVGIVKYLHDSGKTYWLVTHDPINGESGVTFDSEGKALIFAGLTLDGVGWGTATKLADGLIEGFAIRIVNES